MASLFIRKYRTFECCKSAISRVPHTIEKIEPACRAYLQWTDPLPSIHFTLRRCSSIKEKLTHLLIVVVREVDVSCQTYGDDYWSSSPALSPSHLPMQY
jgi:hypothetical protein